VIDDLFNPRAALKPVREFNELLVKALPAGRCECDRCRVNSYNQAPYKLKHSVAIDGVEHRRVFSISSKESIDQAITAAWESFYKADRPVSHVVDVDALLGFTDPEKGGLLLELLTLANYMPKSSPPGLYDTAPGGDQ